jgi:hypothetical protein
LVFSEKERFLVKISGFSFGRNAVKLHYPIVEAIESILPIVDEFVVAVGKGDSDDTTLESVGSIQNPKLKIIETVWDEKYCHRGAINAVQTDIAMKACTGDWLFYVQADEVVHEKYHPVIRARCEKLLEDKRIEGLLFRYKHFWGDYDHYHDSHRWYPYEIRIVRNHPNIHSFESAQSFRYFETWEHPRQNHGTRKLRVAHVDAEIYHYGWVRPPHIMQMKNRAFHSIHWGFQKAKQHYDASPSEFDYGPLDRLCIFQGTHPRIMQNRIRQMNWQDKLQTSGRPNTNRQPHPHERMKYRILTWIEKKCLRGRRVASFKNYRLLKNV